MSTRNVYVVGNHKFPLGWLKKDYVHVKNIDEAHLVVFRGGEDVDPKIYNQKKHPTTHSNPIRDQREIAIYNIARLKNIPCLGICRGGQLLTALQPNGMLVQHQDDPFYMHELITHDGKNLLITSAHHQAMYPFNMNKDDYKILGWTEKMLSFHQNGEKEELNPEKECEIVYYPKTNCLGIQGHPEWMDENSPTIEWVSDLVESFINKQI